MPESMQVNAEHMRRLLVALDRVRAYAELWTVAPQASSGRDRLLQQAVMARCGKTLLGILKELDDA